MKEAEIAVKEKLTLDEMRWLVERYIKEVRGRDVNIALRLSNNQLDIREYQLLFAAFSTAAEYFATKDLETKN
jgi:hypothetical protein